MGQLAEDLVVLGEAAVLVLGEEQLAVERHVKLALAPGDDAGGEAALFLDCGRETRGAGLVVSDLAVADFDLVHAP